MLRKFAAFDVLEATLAPQGGSALRAYAHRHQFTYEPRPGYLYVRSRAISSRTNDNFDTFPPEEIKSSYQTFVGKPVFVNHHNDNHRRARGVVIDAALHEDRNPDGSPDVWAEVLMEVDAVRFPKLAKAILAGHIDRTSMGTDVAYSLCSFCGNKATTPLEYCQHIPKMKGKRIYRTTASGKKEGVLVSEICHGLKFFENSLLVEEPADPTAFFTGVEDHSTARTASKVAHGDHSHPEDKPLAPHQPEHHVGDAIYHPHEGWGGRVIGVHPDHWHGHQYTVRLGPSGWEDDDAKWQPDRNSAPSSPSQERRVREGDIQKSPYMSGRNQSPAHFASKTAGAGTHKQPLIEGHWTEHDATPRADGSYRASCQCGYLSKPYDNHIDAYVDKLDHGGSKNPDYNLERIQQRMMEAQNPKPAEPVTPEQRQREADHEKHYKSWSGTNKENWALASKTATPYDPELAARQQAHWDRQKDYRSKGLCDCKGSMKIEPHTPAEHADWATRMEAAGKTDGWGEPLHQPYDGHGAWSCNNRSCAEHPDHLYEQKPGQAPGWMQAEHDPHKDLTREVGKAFHDKGLTEDAHYLLDQQHQGPTKFSAKKPEYEPPTVSGVALRAADTGRIFMIQRSNKDEKDPARGTWEFPGGHHEEGDKTSLHAGIREWEEEVGQKFPEGGVVSHTWRTGPYQGHMVVVPKEEDAVDLSKGRKTTNPDDPDCDDHEQSAWWDPEHARKNPALRQECKDNWKHIVPGLKDKAASVYLQTEATERKRLQEMAPHEVKAFRKHQESGRRWNRQNPAHADNIIAHWNACTPHERETGMNWYQDAHHLTKHVAADTKTPMHVAAGLMSNYSPQTHWATNMLNAAKSMKTKKGLGGKGSGIFATSKQKKVAERLHAGEHYDKVLSGPKTHAFAHLIEHGGNADPEKPHVVIDRHALSVAAGSRARDIDYEMSGLGAKKRYKQVADEYHKAAKHISKHTGIKVEAHQVQAATWLARQRLNSGEDKKMASYGKISNDAVTTWNDYAGEHHPLAMGKEPGTGYTSPHDAPEDVKHSEDLMSEGHHGTLHASVPPTNPRRKSRTDFGRTAGQTYLAYGETKAPEDVDTLRDEECPVCGEADAYDGNRCDVCGFDAPPKMFQDPDLDLAKQLDLRKDIAQDGASDPNGDGFPDVIPGHGGFGDESQPPGAEMVPDQDDVAQQQVNQIMQQQAPLDPAMLDHNGQPTLDAAMPGAPQDPLAQDLPMDPNALPMQPQDIAGQNPVDEYGQPEPGTPEDGVADLVCPACGYQEDGNQPLSTDMDSATNPAEGKGALCPNCQSAPLMSAQDMADQTGVNPVQVKAHLDLAFPTFVLS